MVMDAKMRIIANYDEIRRARTEKEENGMNITIPKESYKNVTYTFKLGMVTDCYPDGKGNLILCFPHKEIVVLYDEKIHKTVQAAINGYDVYALIHAQ
jgi:hypothetical protein